VLLPFHLYRSRKHPHRSRRLALEQLEQRLVLDVSAPVILQADDASYATLENRVPDLFAAGYSQLLTPPPGRADSGNQSVGYDVYNRFDLGGPGNPTLYGTETGLKALVAAVHQAGGSYYSDLVWNHDGFSNLGTPGFAAAGGYPGFALTLNGNNYAGYNDVDGDFHSAFDNSLTGMRLSGLIDIAQEKNYQFIRSPVDPNNPMNLPAGTTPAFGRLANVPDPNNARFYPDQSLQPISVFDPTTGEQNIKIYPFNNANPLNGTPVLENALGYLMRYTQWLVQTVGVDGFRLDAAKNMPPWVLNYYDRAVYRSSFRTLLNGSQEPIFGFGEVFDGDKSLIQQYIRKDINPSDPGRIGGNRDALDFPLYFAMQQNLSGNGFQNDWGQVVNASQDSQDDGLANNGSQGVSFVSSHDSFGPYLSNVAYAYTLMRPGNTIVYFNAHEFGNRDFPKDGRGDALGGLYGNTITNLVNIRNTHPDGNYDQRDLEKEILIYERDDSMLVGLSNRLDSGFDSRTVHTNFAPGTYLIELTGNAGDPTVDPFHDLPPLVQVDGNGNASIRVPRNRNANGVETDKGYVIYAPSGPQGALTLTNVAQVIPGQTPTAATNGTARLSPIDVLTGNTFQIQLSTNDVNLLGNSAFHDQNADGDNALIKIDGGIDVTGQGFVSTNPGDTAYGFQQFTTVHSPGYFNANGNGQYAQTIDLSQLSNGYHYITVRAFRHRNPGEPPIFTDFRVTIYVDRAPTVSAIVSFNPIVASVNENRQLVVRSNDLRANNVHVFFDLPAGLTTAQVLAMVGSANQATQIDRDLWTMNVNGLTNGNHVATVVSYQVDGSANVQRFPGLYTSTIFGAGLGDLNFDGHIDATDVNLFGQVLASNNSQFNPAADLNGDGLVNNSDLLLLYPRLQQVGASAATFAAYNQLLGPTAGGYKISEGNSLTLAVNQPSGTGPALTFSWDLNNDSVFGDAGATAGSVVSWSQLQALGINDESAFPITLRVSDGTNTINLPTILTVQLAAPTIALSGNAMTTEGVPYTLTLGAVRDPGNDDTVTSYVVHWGDGSSDTYTTGGALTHTYREEQNPATITVDLVDDDGTHTNAGSFALAVGDTVPQVSAGGDVTITSGQALSRTGSFTDPSADGSWMATVNYGDGGGTQTLSLNADKSFVLSHPYLALGDHTVTVTVTDDEGVPGTASFVVHVMPTTVVQSVVINDGSAQRSMVTSVTVTFAGQALIGPGTFRLSRAYAGVTGDVSGLLAWTVGQTADGRTTVTLTFSGAGVLGGSLPDGRYTLTVAGSTVPGGSFFRLFGDVNGDGQVDATDLQAFLAAYRSRKGMANYRTYFDFNADGFIDSVDYYQFQRRYKTRLNADGSISNLP
jgi:alpha-amylase